MTGVIAVGRPAAVCSAAVPPTGTGGEPMRIYGVLAGLGIALAVAPAGAQEQVTLFVVSSGDQPE